jgi:hypothetical protein
MDLARDTTMKEKRKLKRRYLLYYARVFDQEHNDLIGHLADITTEGAMLISEQPLETDQIHCFKLELSADVSEQPYLAFSARCLWCQPDINPEYYSSGIQLLDLSAGQVAIIERIVAAYGFRDN